ncbi:MAG: DUF748 domain-containing protein [Comamonadaceae bacterium]|nr:DUF748 domain-containing protein [Comamonadaceae bacterium]
MQWAAAWGRYPAWLRRVVVAALVVLLLYLLAWLAVPPIARAQIEKLGSEALGRRVSVERVEFNPFTLEATIHGLAVASAAGDAPQVQVARIYANAAVQSVWRLAPVIDALQIDAPVVHASQTAPGAFDFDDVLQRLAERPSTPSDEPARFALYNLELRDGSVDFDDRAVGARHSVRALALSLPFLSTFKADRAITVTPRLAFKLDGSAFDSSAQATPFEDARQTHASLQIRDFNLASLAGYIPASVPVKLRAATLNGDLTLEFSEREATPLVRVGGSLHLAGVDVADAQDAPLLAFEQLNVALADVRPLERVVQLASVELVAPHLSVRRDASGAVVVPGLAQQGEAPTAPVPEGDAQGPLWHFGVQKVQVQGGVLDWHDASLPASGQRDWQVRDWQAQASDVAWPLEQPLHFDTTLQLVGGAAHGAPAQLQAQGEATARQAKVAVTVRGLALALAQPYLAQTLRPVLSGVVDAALALERDGDALVLKAERVALDKFTLACAERKGCRSLREEGARGAAPGVQLALQQLEVAQAAVDLKRHHVTVARVAVRQPQALALRDKAGAWVFDDWLVAPARPAPAAAPSAAPAWGVQVNELQVQGGSVLLRDAAAASPVRLDLAGLDVGVRDLRWDDGRVPRFGLHVQTQVVTRRAEPGKLQWDGTVALAPVLQVGGKVRASNLPLQVLQPYLAQDLNVEVLRADGRFAGDVRVAQSTAGLSVGVEGDAGLDEVHVRVAQAGRNASAAATSTVGERGEDLLRWKALTLQGVTLALAPAQPLALDVRETALTDFFARVIVQESGRINLQDIRADDGSAPPPPESGVADAAGPAPKIHFGPVALTNGTVDFTDHFIRPNYSAKLTELTGRLSAFSSEPQADGTVQMAQLELRGRAQGTATLDISGQLNPLAKPLALDIQGHMRDLELAPLSPYSVKYAGHGIERGKLNMDVAYKVQPDGQLTASNKLVLKQLAFGDEVKGAPNSLPVRLAVALLADRNGVIDVDLPISGSLNDPEFSLGPVILKVIGNLIMKAITAPFSLIASALAGGDEQGNVAFAPGSTRLDSKAREQLDGIAKALDDRPALKATVIGWADPAAEREAWKHERLQALLLAQKRQDAVRAGKDATAITTVDEAERAALLRQVYRRADNLDKPRNLIGIAKTVPDAEMEKLLLGSISVPADAMSELALARSVAVRDYLAAQRVPADRLFVGASKLREASAQGPSFTPHAELQLSAR